MPVALVEEVATVVTERVSARIDALEQRLLLENSDDITEALQRIETLLETVVAWIKPTEAAVIPLADLKPKARVRIR